MLLEKGHFPGARNWFSDGQMNLVSSAVNFGKDCYLILLMAKHMALQTIVINFAQSCLFKWSMNSLSSKRNACLSVYLVVVFKGTMLKALGVIMCTRNQISAFLYLLPRIQANLLWKQTAPGIFMQKTWSCGLRRMLCTACQELELEKYAQDYSLPTLSSFINNLVEHVSS